MQLLQERIRREGKVLPGNIIKVDGFLNHRVDTKLLEALADEFAKYFDTNRILELVLILYLLFLLSNIMFMMQLLRLL